MLEQHSAHCLVLLYYFSVRHPWPQAALEVLPIGGLEPDLEHSHVIRALGQ